MGGEGSWIRSAPGPGAAERAVKELIERWQHGEPDLEEIWTRHGGSLSVLAALAKEDLRCRFVRGQRPAAAAYLERFSDLQAERDRVVSLVYEEYCLREERGEPLDPEQFCDRYEPWRDSLESQLRYHRLLSQVVGPSSAPPRFPEPGERFRWFYLRSILGQGGAARVYLADDEELGGRRVALKVSPDRGEEPSILGRLDHAHIVPVLSVAREPETGLRGLCMPYQPGLPLDEVLRRVGSPLPARRGARVLWDALDWPDAAEAAEALRGPGWAGFPLQGTFAEAAAWIVAELARALGHAHSRGILHRDVKPANVLLARHKGPQLLDFNLAHDPHAPSQAEAALRGGTLPYMAPEQLEAFLDPGRWDDVGEAADLYALGLVFSELLAGHRPEAPNPELSLPRALRGLLDHRSGAPPSLRVLNPAVPHALDAIATYCLAPTPQDRYPDALALAEDLQCFLDRQPLRYASNPSKMEVASHWARRHRRRIALVLMLLATPAVILPVTQATIQRAHRTAQDYINLGTKAAQRGQWIEATEQFEHAQQLDSTLFMVYQGLANIAYHDQRFEDSHRELTQAIELAEREVLRVDDGSLAILYRDRAGSSISWGEQLRVARPIPALHEATQRFADALEDLKRVRHLSRGDSKLLSLADLSAAHAEVGLGDCATRLEQAANSVDHYKKANTFLDSLLRGNPSNRAARTLSRAVEDRFTRISQKTRRYTSPGQNLRVLEGLEVERQQ
jgi:serine/threonine protein kinase